MNNSNFKLCDWKENFFPYVYNFTKEKTQNQCEKALLVFPTSRARKICIEYIQSIEKNIFLPQILTLDEFLEYCQLNLFSTDEISATQIDVLDNIFLLYEIVQKVAKQSEKKYFKSLLGNTLENRPSFLHKELKSFPYFYQYGLSLFEILQECLEEYSFANPITNAHDAVDDFSAFLLLNIRLIFDKYREELDKRNITVRSYNKYKLAEKIQKFSSDSLTVFSDKKIIFSGLDILCNADECVLKHFEESGAEFLFISDPKLANDPENAHWCTSFYKDLSKKWKKQFELLPFKYSENYSINSDIKQVSSIENKVQYFFHQAFDVHSQFQNLTIPKGPQRKACVLNSEASLLPLLYTLNNEYEESELNVALGFPLRESKLFQCVFYLEEMIKSSRKTLDNNEHYLYDNNMLLGLLSYDFLPFLRDDIKQNIKIKSRPYISLVDVFQEKQDLENAIQIIEKWAKIDNLYKLILWIENFADLLSHAFKDNNFEQLALLSLKDIAQKWKQKDYLSESLSHELCVRIFFEELGKKTIPFEHHSDDALQVLSLNQTKNLQYDILHIFDVNDEFLPGKRKENPLLPEKLRPLLSLRSLHIFEQVKSHAWYKLLAGAKEVHLYWQESSSAALFDSKKIKSPLVEEVLWKLEQENNALLDVTQALKNKENQFYTQASCDLELVQRKHSITVDEQIRKDLHEFSLKSFSASSLDVFLECPLKFFYKYICNFSSVDVIEEEDNHAIVGTVVHNFIKNLYTENESLDKSQLYARFENNLNHLDSLLLKENAFELFPSESIFLLKKSIPYRLKKYIHEQPDEVHIALLERKLEAIIDNTMKIYGFIDRVDTVRDANGKKESVIYDYKTGSLKNLPSADFWNNKADTFEGLKLDSSQASEGHPLLAELYKEMPSVQLPLYYYLAYANALNPANAAYIDLADTCKEHCLFDENVTVDMPKKVAIVLKFLQNYMQNIDVLSAHNLTSCDFCSYAIYCS